MKKRENYKYIWRRNKQNRTINKNCKVFLQESLLSNWKVNVFKSEKRYKDKSILGTVSMDTWKGLTEVIK